MSGIAWLSYLPLPGLHWLAIRIAPDDPLTRYHAWQGGALVLSTWALMILFALLGGLSDATAYQATVGFLLGLILLAALVGIVWGIVAAAMGRYFRLRPVWDVLAVIKR